MLKELIINTIPFFPFQVVKFFKYSNISNILYFYQFLGNQNKLIKFNIFTLTTSLFLSMKNVDVKFNNQQVISNYHDLNK